MEQQLTQNLNEILGWVKSGGNFVIEQAPLYAQEYLAYEFVSNIIWGTFTFFCFVGFAYLLNLIIKKWPKLDYHDYDGYGVIGVMCAIGVISCLIGSICHFQEAIKCKVAPRVVIVDKLSRMVK